MKTYDEIVQELYRMLKDSGCLGSVIVRRKLKLTHTASKKIIKEMHDSDKNYRFALKRTLVGYIGAHPCLVRRKRKSKWVDITKSPKKSSCPI